MKRFESRVNRVMPMFACALLASALQACSGMRPAATAPAPSAAPPAAENAAPPPEPEAANPTPADTAEHDKPASADVKMANCVPPETKPKPKAKPKPRAVRREAPPQLPTAPVVAATPVNGVVDAQVRQMPVSVMSILGKRVQGPGGEDLGRVVDVLADAGGRVRVAIVDFGGFLGVGDRRIAVDWPLLRFNPTDGDTSLLLSVSRDKLQSAPEYKQTSRPQTLMEPVAPPSAQGPLAQGESAQGQSAQGPSAQGQGGAPAPAQPAQPTPASAASADSKK